MLTGFKCPLQDGKEIVFDYCYKDCPNKCQPLPLLIALGRGRRVQPGRYSVTEITAPPRVVYLKRRYEYFVKPEDQIFMVLGSGMHEVIEGSKWFLAELGVNRDYKMEGDCFFEKKVETPSGEATLIGTPDLYVEPERTLYDWKSIKFYWDGQKLLGGQGVKPEYALQLNMYRWGAFPKAKRLVSVNIIKDWSRQLRDRFQCPKIITVDVPVQPLETIETWIKSRLSTLMEAETGKLCPEPCTPEECWYPKTREWIRCDDYCEVNTFCDEYEKRRKNGAHKSGIL